MDVGHTFDDAVGFEWDGWDDTKKKQSMCKPTNKKNEHKNDTNDHLADTLSTEHGTGQLTTETKVAAFSDSGPSEPDMVAAND